MRTTQSAGDLRPRIETAHQHEQIYAYLRQCIMAGKFRPGQVLTLRGIAAELGTSIMPARDAILRLTADRALEQRGRGVRIPVLDMSRFEDVLRFRILLEGDACALAAQRVTANELAGIEAAAARAVSACENINKDYANFLSANQAFHFAVYQAAHSELLQSLIETLWLQVGPHLGLVLMSAAASGPKMVDLTGHERLIAALRRRNPAAAREALQMDLKDSVDVFRPLVAPTPVVAIGAKPRRQPALHGRNARTATVARSKRGARSSR